MARKNEWLEKLRDYGANDYQLRKLRRLARQFEEDDIYEKIGKYNEKILDTYIRPTDINYENVFNAMDFFNKDIKDVIADYEKQFRYIQEGTTQEATNYYNRIEEELKDYGIFSVFAVKYLAENDFVNFQILLDLLDKLKKYDEIADTKRAENLKKHIQSIINTKAIQPF